MADDFYMANPNPDDFRPGAGDDKLLVIFHMDIVKDEERSTAEGRPIWRDEEFIRIFVPGDKSNVIDRPIRPTDRARFPKQYAAFKEDRGEEAQIVGTHLRDWPMVGRAQVAEFAHFGIRTVEQLADVRDDLCQKIMGLTGLKQVAGVWLQKAKSTGEAARVAKRLDDAESANKDLQTSMARLMATNEALQAQIRDIVGERVKAAA